MGKERIYTIAKTLLGNDVENADSEYVRGIVEFVMLATDVKDYALDETLGAILEHRLPEKP